jgi:hypothetical protein
MAYTRSIVPPKCQECTRPATVEVMNRFNAPCGKFCAKHGGERARDLTKREMDADKESLRRRVAAERASDDPYGF